MVGGPGYVNGYEPTDCKVLGVCRRRSSFWLLFPATVGRTYGNGLGTPRHPQGSRGSREKQPDRCQWGGPAGANRRYMQAT